MITAKKMIFTLFLVVGVVLSITSLNFAETSEITIIGGITSARQYTEYDPNSYYCRQLFAAGGKKCMTDPMYVSVNLGFNGNGSCSNGSKYIITPNKDKITFQSSFNLSIPPLNDISVSELFIVDGDLSPGNFTEATLEYRQKIGDGETRVVELKGRFTILRKEPTIPGAPKNRRRPKWVPGWLSGLLYG
ncbi:MAG: hypothetical protein HYY63_01065 [Elusimicrobia bacterium]|nr:hypothetical protein [Elusimicrobiota bacterium]MBI4217998.1 hypothetical protein [Elusimicrobiota bacterium]